MPKNLLTPEKMRSPCPIANTLDIIGDKWTLLIIRDMMTNKRRYGELESSPEGIRTNILASRLKLLVSTKLIKKTLYQAHPPRYEYTLSESGQALRPILKELEKWGLEHVEDTHAYMEI